jgi:hypothetical protein
MAKIRPPADTTELTLARVWWLRHHSGSASHCMRRGGPATASSATALLPASCRKWVHSSMFRGRGFTAFVHFPPCFT